MNGLALSSGSWIINSYDLNWKLIGQPSETLEPSVKVFKSRGSVQCTGDGGIAPEVMRNELITAGIDVGSFSCGIDGLAYATLCGAPDGAINIFNIPQNKINQATFLGFASLSTLPNAQETQCR
jgi:hypothetical protein